MTQSDFPFAVAAINEHVYRLRIRQPFSQAYLYYWLSSRRMLDEMWLRGTGAAIPGLNSSNVKGLPIAVPPSERLVKILPLVDNLLLDLHQRAKESRVLANLRNTLIPELLSGRLRVKESESMMENV
jgi:type I restriction enzyme S subunit